MKEEAPLFNTNHIEADTKITYHICNIDDHTDGEEVSGKNNLIKGTDTDILIILLGNMHQLCYKEHRIFLKISSGINTRHIRVRQIFKELGGEVAKAYLAFMLLHAVIIMQHFIEKEKELHSLFRLSKMFNTSW